MLVHRLRLRPNIKPASGQNLVFVGDELLMIILFVRFTGWDLSAEPASQHYSTTSSRTSNEWKKVNSVKIKHRKMVEPVMTPKVSHSTLIIIYGATFRFFLIPWNVEWEATFMLPPEDVTDYYGTEGGP